MLRFQEYLLTMHVIILRCYTIRIIDHIQITDGLKTKLEFKIQRANLKIIEWKKIEFFKIFIHPINCQLENDFSYALNCP